MSVREAIDKHRTHAIAITVIIIVGALVYIVHRSTASVTAPRESYFSIDDGKTYFVDSLDHLAPYDYKGQTAFRAWVFSCDDGKTSFVGYLERYTPQAKSKIESEIDAYKTGRSHVSPGINAIDTEVKKPGPGNPWISKANALEVAKVLNVQCPNGSGQPEVQLP